MTISNNDSIGRPRFGLRYLVGAFLVAAVVMAVIAVKHCCFDNRPGDVLMAALCSLDGDFTVYSGGFRESRFRSIRAGMTAREVEEIIGPPMDKGQWMDGSGTDRPLDEYWSYSREGKANGSYWKRAIYFRDRVVWRTDRSFYVD